MSDEEAIQEIDEDTCRKLLGRRHFGRVGVVDDEGPVIFPVNYVLDGDDIVFRTDPGIKQSAAAGGRAACFEIDDVDTGRRFGWNVLARGRLDEVVDDDERERLRRILPRPFPGGRKAHVVRLSCTVLSGRRIPLPEDAAEEGHGSPKLGNLWEGQDGSDLLG